MSISLSNTGKTITLVVDDSDFEALMKFYAADEEQRFNFLYNKSNRCVYLVLGSEEEGGYRFCQNTSNHGRWQLTMATERYPKHFCKMPTFGKFKADALEFNETRGTAKIPLPEKLEPARPIHRPSKAERDAAARMAQEGQEPASATSVPEPGDKRSEPILDARGTLPPEASSQAKVRAAMVQAADRLGNDIKRRIHVYPDAVADKFYSFETETIEDYNPNRIVGRNFSQEDWRKSLAAAKIEDSKIGIQVAEEEPNLIINVGKSKIAFNVPSEELLQLIAAYTQQGYLV